MEYNLELIKNELYLFITNVKTLKKFLKIYDA